jgi:hypothetical protein
LKEEWRIFLVDFIAHSFQMDFVPHLLVL